MPIFVFISSFADNVVCMRDANIAVSGSGERLPRKFYRQAFYIVCILQMISKQIIMNGLTIYKVNKTNRKKGSVNRNYALGFAIIFSLTAINLL